MIAILWGLAAALSFGTADVFARGATAREGAWRAVFYLQLIGLFTVIVVLPLTGEQHWALLWGPAGWLLVWVSLLMMAGTASLYRALYLGPMVITSPVASSFAAVTAVLAIVAGERLLASQGVGLVLTLIGVVLAGITVTGKQDKTARAGGWGVVFALGTVVMHGTAFFLLDQLVAQVGEGVAVLGMRMLTLSILLLVFPIAGQSWRLQERDSWRWLLPVGILDTLANLFYGFGVNTGLTSVVSVLTALYSVVTVLIGYFWLRESMSTTQKIGVGIVFVGVALVTAG